MAQSSRPRPAAVIGGNRLPFARANGAYANASNQDLLTASLEGLVARFGLAGERLGEVVAGAVLKHSRDFNLTREAVLGSSLSARTPAFDVQQACGTGLEAAILVANKIALGQIDSGVAGGTDTASDAPIAVSEGLRETLLRLNRATTTGQRVKALSGLRPGHVVPEVPRNVEPRTGLSMGEHMAQTAKRWGITREAQDDLAAASHRNLAAAYERGFFDDLMTPFLGRHPRREPAPGLVRREAGEAQAGVRQGRGRHHDRGEQHALTDGASVVLLGTDEWAAERGLPVLAHVVDAETAAVDYVTGNEGLLMAPAYALPRLLERQGMTLQDFDLVEIHEAFASTVLATLAAWEDAEFCRERLGLSAPMGALDRSRLNVAGSSLAAGHPFAATGGRIVASLAKLLQEKGPGSRGLISICAAGGQGVMAILEAA